VRILLFEILPLPWHHMAIMYGYGRKDVNSLRALHIADAVNIRPTPCNQKFVCFRQLSECVNEYLDQEHRYTSKRVAGSSTCNIDSPLALAGRVVSAFAVSWYHSHWRRNKVLQLGQSKWSDLSSWSFPHLHSLFLELHHIYPPVLSLASGL